MEQKDYRLAAIMYTDIAGFSRMMETDETGTLETLGKHNTIISDSVAGNRGRVIKSVGDVFLCEFPNTVDAVRSAIEIQNSIAEHNESAPAVPFAVRIGVHLGDIYFFEDDALGEGVSIANRLESLAHPGRICISQDVFNLVSSKLDLNAQPLGQSKLRGISREIGTYEITVHPAAELSGPAESLPSAPGDSAADGSETRSAAGRVGSALRENLRRPEYADFNELKALVLSEIKKAGRRLSVDDIRSRIPDRSPGTESALETLADRGFLTRERPDYHNESSNSIESRVSDTIRSATSRRGAEVWVPGFRGPGRPPVPPQSDAARERARWDRALEAAPTGLSGPDPLVEDYKDHAAAIAEKEKAGFRGHLISYAAVNGGLFFLWSMVMFGGFPWFLIVAAGWGIGLVSHYFGVKQKVRESAELDQMAGLTRDQLRLYRKLAKVRSNWSGHLVSNVATSVFLLALNLIVSPGFLWAAFPIGFMAIGLFSHLPAFKSKERRLLKRLREAGVNIAHLLRGKRVSDEPASNQVVSQPDTAGYEAEQVKQRIVSKMNALPDNSPVGEDFMPVLDNYIEQIKMLDLKSRELDEIMRGIPVSELQRDLHTLQKQRSESESAKVVAEYDQSIQQIEKQQTSFAELKNEREILRLRLSSGLSQLKQMEIDLARMASLSSDDDAASLGSLKDKSDELSQYLDDLREGYRELE